MNIVAYIFWISLFIIFYTYLGYGIFLFFFLKLKRFFRKAKQKLVSSEDFTPPVSLIIAAYNEKDYIDIKAWNMLSLHYPEDKLEVIFVTDGSDDGSPELLKEKFPKIKVLHLPERKGKIAAMNRAIKYAQHAIVIFNDANTIVHPKSIRRIVEHYRDPRVGAVAGEKRIQNLSTDQASGAGEGIYWKYESWLKSMDSELYSVVGAAGELFSVRKSLFVEVEPNAILDDFIISLRIAQQGFLVKYEPMAYSVEMASSSVKDEIKRKVRISAGGIQSIIWLRDLLNPIKHGLLSFQYISHRVLRWTLTPLALALVLITNMILAFASNGFYDYLLIAQLGFYLMALLGWLLENYKIKVKALFVPFYFTMMNVCVYLGFLRFLRGRQSVVWEKARRAQ